jgi:hypothetical protein
VRAQQNQESITFFNVHQYGLIKSVEDNFQKLGEFDCSSLITVSGTLLRES